MGQTGNDAGGGDGEEPVDAATVLRIAELARIGVDEEEAARLGGQLRAILGYFHLLAEAELPPGIDLVGDRGGEELLREDSPVPTTFGDALVRGAPRSSGSFVVVPAVLPQDGSGSQDLEY